MTTDADRAGVMMLPPLFSSLLILFTHDIFHTGDLAFRAMWGSASCICIGSIGTQTAGGQELDCQSTIDEEYPTT